MSYRSGPEGFRVSARGAPEPRRLLPPKFPQPIGLEVVLPDRPAVAATGTALRLPNEFPLRAAFRPKLLATRLRASLPTAASQPMEPEFLPMEPAFLPMEPEFPLEAAESLPKAEASRLTGSAFLPAVVAFLPKALATGRAPL
jgi:hypothetical protein